ncbi:MAG: HAD-IA family hydrolase [Pseudomonadales bacterium]|nr:HAD-IA family hydrolase [Pseudomonadales bacterium]
MGGDSRKSAQIVIDHFSLPISVDEYLEEREARLEELFPLVTEIDGAGAFVEHLKVAGITMGLATSSHSRLCRLKLQGKAWADHFDAVICGDNPALHNPKPAPDIFLLCARAVGAQPHDCIAIEDSPNGITAAIDAGMTVIAINSPWVDREDLADASMIVDSYHELLGMATWKG